MLDPRGKLLAVIISFHKWGCSLPNLERQVRKVKLVIGDKLGKLKGWVDLIHLSAPKPSMQKPSQLYSLLIQRSFPLLLLRLLLEVRTCFITLPNYYRSDSRGRSKTALETKTRQISFLIHLSSFLMTHSLPQWVGHATKIFLKKGYQKRLLVPLLKKLQLKDRASCA